MLLPKRIISKEHLHNKLLQREKELGIQRKKKFKDLLREKHKVEDFYIFDEEDAVIVVDNPDKDSREHYLMIHYRYMDKELQEMNRWKQVTHFFGPTSHHINRELNLFMVPGGRDIYHPSWDCCGSIYNYKTCEFVVEKGKFDGISTTNRLAGVGHAIPEINYLQEAECFLGNFEVRSEYQEDDIIHYTNPITKEDMSYSFCFSEIYFAFINLDGTIRDNKLFRGRNLSRIEKIIDLEDSESLEHFKNVRKEILTKEKEKEKRAYYEKKSPESLNFISPYKDAEVAKVLRKIKDKN